MTPPAPNAAPSLEVLDYKLTLALEGLSSIKDDVAALRKAGEDARVELALHDRRISELEAADEKRSGRSWEATMALAGVPLSVIAAVITALLVG